MRNLFFVGMLLVVLFCGASAVLVKEDGAEDCDAVAIEKVLAQAREITESAAFLRELKPELDDTKKVIERLVEESDKELLELVQIHEQSLTEGKKDYDESINRYFGGQTVNLK